MFRVTRYPMISKTESGRVAKEIPGSGSGSGTRWALVIGSIPEGDQKGDIYTCFARSALCTGSLYDLYAMQWCFIHAQGRMTEWIKSSLPIIESLTIKSRVLQFWLRASSNSEACLTFVADRNQAVFPLFVWICCVAPEIWIHYSWILIFHQFHTTQIHFLNK